MPAAAPALPNPDAQAKERALALLNKLWNDSVHGAAIQKAAKEMWPETPTTDETFAPVISPLKSQIDQLAADLKTEREERAAEKKAREENEQKLSMEQKLDSARKKYNLTDEGFDKMVSRMKETGNYYDADAAGAWVAQSAPPKEVPGPTWMPQDINLFGGKEKDEALATLWKNPERFFDNEVSEMLRNPDKYVAETFGAAA